MILDGLWPMEPGAVRTPRRLPIQANGGQESAV